MPRNRRAPAPPLPPDVCPPGHTGAGALRPARSRRPGPQITQRAADGYSRRTACDPPPRRPRHQFVSSRAALSEQTGTVGPPALYTPLSGYQVIASYAVPAGYRCTAVEMGVGIAPLPVSGSVEWALVVGGRPSDPSTPGSALQGEGDPIAQWIGVPVHPRELLVDVPANQTLSLRARILAGCTSGANAIRDEVVALGDLKLKLEADTPDIPPDC